MIPAAPAHGASYRGGSASGIAYPPGTPTFARVSTPAATMQLAASSSSEFPHAISSSPSAAAARASSVMMHAAFAEQSNAPQPQSTGPRRAVNPPSTQFSAACCMCASDLDIAHGACITSCQHFLCPKCLAKYPVGHCPRCQKPARLLRLATSPQLMERMSVDVVKAFQQLAVTVDFQRRQDVFAVQRLRELVTLFNQGHRDATQRVGVLCRDTAEKQAMIERLQRDLAGSEHDVRSLRCQLDQQRQQLEQAQQQIAALDQQRQQQREAAALAQSFSRWAAGAPPASQLPPGPVHASPGRGDPPIRFDEARGSPSQRWTPRSAEPSRMGDDFVTSGKRPRHAGDATPPRPPPACSPTDGYNVVPKRPVGSPSDSRFQLATPAMTLRGDARDGGSNRYPPHEPSMSAPSRSSFLHEGSHSNSVHRQPSNVPHSVTTALCSLLPPANGATGGSRG